MKLEGISPNSILLSQGLQRLPSVFAVDDLINKTVAILLRTASYLTDPFVKWHEYMRRFQVVDALHPKAYRASNFARKFLLAMGICGAGCLASVASIPGVALRSIALCIQKEPFVYAKGEAKDKIMSPDRNFSLLSWNVCCTAGGYSISDGGVLPWSFRIDEIAAKIIEKDADVNCIYEVFDTESAFYLSERLKEKGYGHIYFSIGQKAIGLSSGILIASKYAVKNPEFTAFSKDTLVGRTKHVAKGVFAFDLQTQGKRFARIHATHLQHSEECVYPTCEEVDARRKQMEMIIEKAEKVKDACIVVTGDLNLDDDEYNSSSWRHRFEKGDRFEDPQRTWGGDEFCARLVGKRISHALNLDHTLALSGSVRAMNTSFVDVGFDPTKYKKKALSDHAGLFSEISI